MTAATGVLIWLLVLALAVAIVVREVRLHTGQEGEGVAPTRAVRLLTPVVLVLLIGRLLLVIA